MAQAPARSRRDVPVPPEVGFAALIAARPRPAASSDMRASGKVLVRATRLSSARVGRFLPSGPCGYRPVQEAAAKLVEGRRGTIVEAEPGAQGSRVPVVAGGQDHGMAPITLDRRRR